MKQHSCTVPEAGCHLKHDVADRVGSRGACLIVLAALLMLCLAAAEDLEVEDGQVDQTALAQLIQDAGMANG